MRTEEVMTIKSSYPIGSTLELVSMDDPWPVEPGARGVVEHVDDAGQIHVQWSNGRRLAVIPGIDEFKLVKGGM